MTKCARLVTVLAVAAAMLSACGCNKLRARDQLNQGVKAYKDGKTEKAIEFFKNAVSLDDKLRVAKLYLATAYAQQYVPDAQTPDNNRNAEMAINEYKEVLAEDPKSLNSLKGIAYLYMNMKRFDDAREYYKKAIDADPNDPETYYSLGVIDWTAVYKDVADRKSKVGLKVDDPLKGTKICDDIKNVDGPRIDEGMKMLQTAMTKRQDYDDAMAYMNLIYRRKADAECGDPQAAEQDIKMANDWSNKAMDARKKKQEQAAKKTSGGIVLEQSQNQNQNQNQNPGQKK